MQESDPYIRKLVTADFYAQKLPLKGRIVAILRGTIRGRDLQLIPQSSRAVRAGEIHEFVATREKAVPGARVSEIAYLCFVEFENGGVVLTGDELVFGGRSVGAIAGFDLSHQPNHMNIVVKVESLMSGEELGLECGAPALVMSPASSLARTPVQKTGRS